MAAYIDGVAKLPPSTQFTTGVTQLTAHNVSFSRAGAYAHIRELRCHLSAASLARFGGPELPARGDGLTQLTDLPVNFPRGRAYAHMEKLRCDASAASGSVGAVVVQAPPIPCSPTLLALDLGTTTGWALRPRDGQIAHGFVSLRPQRFEGGGMRYLRFKRWLTELKAVATEINTVYFEEVRRHAGVDAAHVYGGLMATLTAWCEHHDIPYQGVPVGTIKKHATGKGNAGKDEVIAAMRARGHAVTDDNEADALALLHWAIAMQET